MKRFIRFLRTKIKNPYSVNKLKNLIENTDPIKIIIGSGSIEQAGWISTEIYLLDVTREKDWEMYFSKRKIDAIVSEHVWEHLTEDAAYIATNLCFKYLKKGGYIRIAVPDGFHPDKDYIEQVKVGANAHKVLYNYKTLKSLFEKAGFEVDLLEYHNENNEFIYKDWQESNGLITRSKNHDSRNQNGKIVYTSIIFDAYKK